MCIRFNTGRQANWEGWMQELWRDVQMPELDFFPKSDVLCYTADKGPQAFYWGFHPSWAQGRHEPTANARIESAAVKPFFREAFKQRRCLVPAVQWYERPKGRGWHCMSLADAKSFCLAGLYEYSNHLQKWTFALVTTAAHPSIMPIHDRMPITLTEADAQLWTSGHPFTPSVSMYYKCQPESPPPPQPANPAGKSMQLTL